MQIKREVYERIIASLSLSNHETGGILAIKDEVICDFFFDEGKNSSPYYYEPNTEILDDIIEKWENEGLSFAGIIHSHLKGNGLLSPNDLKYAKLVREAMPDLKHLLFPVLLLTGETPSIRYFECIKSMEEIDVEIID